MSLECDILQKFGPPAMAVLLSENSIQKFAWSKMTLTSLSSSLWTTWAWNTLLMVNKKQQLSVKTIDPTPNLAPPPLRTVSREKSDFPPSYLYEINVHCTGCPKKIALCITWEQIHMIFWDHFELMVLGGPSCAIVVQLVQLQTSPKISYRVFA